MASSNTGILLSRSFCAFSFNFRHVMLPKDMAKALPQGRTLSETEWRTAGIQQSRGWEHYAIHRYLYYAFQLEFLFLINY